MAETTHQYGAFISYSHSLDSEFATSLQSEVERFAKPWNKLRAVRVFRDATNLSAAPGLWPVLETALSESDWFVLLASPQSARSPWVQKEILWWLDHKTPEKILLVLTDGNLVWDDAKGRFDTAASDGLPVALASAFPQEPLWVDARWSRSTSAFDPRDPTFQKAAVDVASAVRGLQKDELVGEAARQHTKTRRLVRLIWAVLSTLLVFAVVAAVVATNQRQQARQQRNAAIEAATLAQSRQLAALSQQEASNDIGVSALLALDSVKLDNNPQSTSALFQASLTDPHLSQILNLGSAVTAIADMRQPGHLILGLKDGSVVSWSTGDRQTQTMGKLSKPVTSVASSDDASNVVATDGTHTAIFRPGHAAVAVRLLQVAAVGVAPSGQKAWAFADGTGSSWTVDLSDATTSENPTLDLNNGITNVIPVSDDELAIFDSTYGAWARIDSNTWEESVSGYAAFGTHEAYAAHSPDGLYLGVANTDGGDAVPVWGTDQPDRDSAETVTSSQGINTPIASALGPGALEVAVANYSSIEVYPSEAGKQAGYAETTLTGGANTDHIAFFGDDNHLVSTSGNRAFLWNLTQSDRLSKTTTIATPFTCNACGEMHLAVSPDENQLAMISDGGEEGFVQNLRTGESKELVDQLNDPDRDNPFFNLNIPVWVGSKLIVPVSSAYGANYDASPVSQTGNVASFPYGQGHADAGSLASTLDDEEDVTSLLDDGTLLTQTPDGAVVSEHRLPWSDQNFSGAFDTSGKTLAYVDKGRIVLVSVSSRKTVAVTKSTTYKYVAFAGSRILGQREDGSLDVLDSHLLPSTTLPGGEQYRAIAVGSPDGRYVARIRIDTSIELDDLRTGQKIGVLPASSGDTFSHRSVLFSRDSNSLFAITQGSPEGTLSVYDLSDRNLRTSACRVANLNLTSAEWRQYGTGTSQPTNVCR